MFLVITVPIMGIDFWFNLMHSILYVSKSFGSRNFCSVPSPIVAWSDTGDQQYKQTKMCYWSRTTKRYWFYWRRSYCQELWTGRTVIMLLWATHKQIQMETDGEIWQWRTGWSQLNGARHYNKHLMVKISSSRTGTGEQIKELQYHRKCQQKNWKLMQ